MRLVWAAAAEADLDEIIRHVAERDLDAAFSLEDRIRDSVERLTQFPQSGRIGFVEGTRELVVAGTAYLIVYQVTDEAVELLHVVHGRRDVGVRGQSAQ